MWDARFLAYLLVSAALIVAPGPDMALVTRNALRGGWTAASQTAFGVAIGLVLWGIASVAGVAALLGASAAAFTVMKLAGALYLTALGLRSLISAARGPEGRGAPPVSNPRRPSAPDRAFWQGLFNNLLNPKAAVIFLSIVPQFVRPGDSTGRLLVMVAVFALLTLGWLHVYGAAVARAGRYFGPRVQRALGAVAGTVMIGLGVRLAFERR
ncbi:MAG TPA: LysE family translocator [bacterium]|nr:LysE family translocator [bacterium]